MPGGRITDRVRRVVRPSLAIAILITFLSPTAVASAAAPGRFMREAAEVTGLVVAGSSPVASLAQRAVRDGGRFFEATWTIRVRGNPYRRWSFNVSEAAGLGAAFFLTTSRTEDVESAVQTYSWERRLSRADVDHSPDLRRLRINTGRHLGSLGKVRLRLQRSSPLSTRTRVCERTGEELFTERTRSGMAEGRVRIRPGLTGMPPRVGDLRMRVRMSETEYTGEVCRRSGGRCRSPVVLGAFEEVSATEFTLLAASVAGWIGAARFVISHRAFDTWVVEHLAWDWPAPLRLESGQAFVSQGYPAGRFQGSMRFDETSEVDTYRVGRRCRATETVYTWDGGSMSALLDAGSMTFTGADFEAFTQVTRRRT